MPVVEALMEKERNGQLKDISAQVVRSLRGEQVESWFKLWKSLKPLYARDKVQRNEAKRMGRRGGR